MFNLICKKSRKRNGREKGQALVLVLVVLTIAALLIPAMLGFIGTGAKSGTLYDRKTSELYAADAGIQDAVWQIKYDNIKKFKETVPAYYIPNPDDPLVTQSYSSYDFRTAWSYILTQPLTGLPIDVTISNQWVPYNVMLPAIDTIKKIIQEGKVTVTGSTGDSVVLGDGTTISPYTIKITYYPTGSEMMQVSKIGIWLPPGCTYYSDGTYNTNFEGSYTDFQQYPYQGNYATVWTFPATLFKNLPEFKPATKLEFDATFWFKPPQDQPKLRPQAVGWIVPVLGSVKMNDGITNLPVSWDADNRVFWLESVSGSTTIDSYIVKSEIRELMASIGGDYYATGNSNLSTSDNVKYRDTWNNPSAATVTQNNIPVNATVAKAFLYWSGWQNEASIGYPLKDNCSTFPGNWTAGSSWSRGGTSSNYYFKATDDSLGAALALTASRNLSTYTGAIVSWKQWVTAGGTSSSQVKTPASDSDYTGTWTITPTTPAGKYVKVNETVTDDSNYITQTATSGGYTYFGYNPAFLIPANATVTNVTVSYRAAVPDPITYRGVGNAASASPGTNPVVVPFPSAPRYANDIYILVASTIAGGTVSITTNGSITTWTPIGSPINVASGEKLYVWWGRYSSGSTGPTVTATSDHCIARIVAYANVITSGSPIDVPQTGTEAASDTTFSFAPGTLTTANSEMCICVCSTGTDITSTAQFSTMANTSLSSLAERMDNETSTGGGGGFALDDGFQSTAGTMGTWTSTLVTASPKAYIAFALKPAVAASYPANVHSGLKVSGTPYDTDPGVVPTSTYPGTDYSYAYTTNPVTNKAWKVAEVNDINVLQLFGVYATQGVSVSKVSITVNYTYALTAADGLYFKVYNTTDGWSNPIKAFQCSDADIVYSIPGENNFSYSIPKKYLTAGFKIQFLLVGFGGTGNYANIDDIQIAGMTVNESVVFMINDQQYSLNDGLDGIRGPDEEGYDDDQPVDGGNLLASKSQYMQNSISGDPSGFSFSCYRDVTAVVQAHSLPQGYATYKVGSIDATPAPKTGRQTEDEIAYAGWSIVIVYESPDTLGHMLYLYDNFKNSGQNTDVDFNGEGGLITGFIVPPQITGAVLTISAPAGTYTTTPAVKITGGGGEGAAAMAIRNPSTGLITRIQIINGGSGYTTPPTVTIVGGGPPNPPDVVVTATIGDEVNVGKITCFVGEGDGKDVGYTGDYLALSDDPSKTTATAPKLWDGITESGVNTKTTPTDVFNSQSAGYTPAMNNGVDIDTLGLDPPNGQYITWASGILHEGDSSATVYLHTEQDVWNLVYIIISFRSVTTTGGSLSYLIH